MTRRPPPQAMSPQEKIAFQSVRETSFRTVHPKLTIRNRCPVKNAPCFDAVCARDDCRLLPENAR